MGFFKSAFSVLSMATTGKVINKIDTPVNGGLCELSLRLKQKDDASDAYVVLAGIASGNYQYYAMTADEFTQFSEAVQATKNLLLNLTKQ